MTSLARRVARAIRDGSLLSPGDRVAVAVSGGADSVALAWLFQELAAAATTTWRLAGLVHVHHGLRGEDADADEAFCRGLASRLGLPIDVVHVDAAAHARAMRRSIEVAARDLRYAAFREAMTRLDATAVATGHTLDDQAETVLLRLLRGAGTRGLAGVRARRGSCIRPLLGCRRADLREYLAARGERFREDASNDDVSIARNRLRHELMPVIERLAPGGARALARCAALAADDEAFLRREVARRAAGVLRLTPGGSTGTPGVAVIDAAALSRLPRAIARRFVRDLAEQVSGQVWSAGHVDDLLALARAAIPAGHLDLPGASVSKTSGTLVLRRSDAASGRRPAAGPAIAERALAVPGETAIPELSATMVARAAATVEEPISSDGGRAVVQADALRLPLTVRARRAGDRFRPLGAPGSRKLQDVFVDRKIPRHERDRIPLVVDAQGRIVWVAGFAPAHDCRVTDPRKGMVILELRR